MRRSDSPLGPGITFTREVGRTAKIEIDISRRLCIRSDGIATGSNKRYRKQCVYTPFIPLFEYGYGFHMRWMEGHSFEKERRSPMFVNRDGMEMTYDNYADRLDELIRNHLRPPLLASSPPP